jgi:hypothetical protein
MRRIIPALAIAGASFAAFALSLPGGRSDDCDDFNFRGCGWPL